MAVGPQLGFRFRDFELLINAHSVMRADERIELTPKEFKVLSLLAERAGTVVEKDMLFKLAWDGAFVTDSSLARAISVLRKRIGPDAIETVSKVGYRFVWPVTPITPLAVAVTQAPLVASSNITPPPARTTRPVRSWLVLLLIMPVAAALLAAVALHHDWSSTPTPSAAQEAFIRGRYEIDQKTAPDFYKAVADLDEAVRIDPHFAAAWASLSEAYINLGSGDAQIRPSFAKAKIAASTALRLDPDLADAHRDLAYILCWDEHDWSGSEREFRTAIRLNPNEAKTHQWFASFLSARRRSGEALAEARKALDLSPVSLGANYTYGEALIQSGHFDEAIRQLQATINRDPENEVAYGYLGIAFNRVGRHADAAEMYQQAFACSGGGNAGYYAGVGWSKALAGDVTTGRRVYDELVERENKGEWVPAYNLLLLALTLQKREEALNWAEKAVQDRSLSIFELNTEPLLTALDSEPRFEKIRSDFK